MAHDLRKIANKGYNCYGNGRDWFFLGDPDYRNGCRTPLPNQTGTNLVSPPHRPRGLSQEVRHAKAVSAAAGGHSGKSKSATAPAERWKRIHDETPEIFGPKQVQAMEQEATARSPGARGARLRGGQRKSEKESKGPSFATSYDQFGRLPKWTGDRYVLPMAEDLRGAGVSRSSSEPVLKEMEGDHTRGIRGSQSHFASTYDSEVGQVPGVPSRRHEVKNAQNLREADVLPARDPVPAFQGDHSQGIKKRTEPIVTTYMELGQEQPLPKWVGERLQVFKCEQLRDAGVHPPPEAPKGSQGDHSQGITGDTPHFFTTSQDIGRYQKFEGKRYDFGPLAYKHYRVTKWK